jgi:hypothetical protein
MLALGRNLLRAAMTTNYEYDIEFVRPALIADSLQAGRTKPNWNSLTVVSTVSGSLQPLNLRFIDANSSRLLELAGMLGREDLYIVYCEPLTLANTDGRLRLNLKGETTKKSYRIMTASHWLGHSAFTVELIP